MKALLLSAVCLCVGIVNVYAGVPDGRFGRAYASTMNNVAARSSVLDGMAWPHVAHGEKRLYVEPVNKMGAAAFGEGNVTWQGGLSAADEDNSVTFAGVSFAEFGALLFLGLDKEIERVDETKAQTDKGDVIGAALSFPVTDALALHVTGNWTTVMLEPDGNHSHYDLEAEVALTNAFSEDEGLVWQGGLAVDRLLLSDKTGGTEKIDPQSYFKIGLAGELGAIVAKTENARLFAGLGAAAAYKAFQSITNEIDAHYSIGFLVSPSVSADVFLWKAVTLFAGVSHDVSVVVEHINDIPGYVKKYDTKVLTGETTAAVGLRWDYDRFGLEAGLRDKFFSDGTSTLFDSDGGANMLVDCNVSVFF